MGRLSNRNSSDKGTNLYNIPYQAMSGATSGVHVFIDESGNVTQIKKKQKERLKYYIDPSPQFNFTPECVIGINGGGGINLYTFSTGTTENDPGHGYLKFNYNITKIFVSEYVSGDTTSNSWWFNNNIVDDGSIYIKVFNKDNINHLGLFNISAITYNIGWYTIDISPIIDFYLFDDGEQVYFTFENANCEYGIGLGIGDNQWAYATYSSQ